MEEYLSVPAHQETEMEHISIDRIEAAQSQKATLPKQCKIDKAKKMSLNI